MEVEVALEVGRLLGLRLGEVHVGVYLILLTKNILQILKVGLVPEKIFRLLAYLM